jgi:hypothetical protein
MAECSLNTYSTTYEIPSALATKYLGAILELPDFWQLRSSLPKQHMVQKLLRRAIILIQDLGIEHEERNDSVLDNILDNEGIDFLVHAALEGINEWKRKCGSRYLVEQLWWDDFLALLKLLMK